MAIINHGKPFLLIKRHEDQFSYRFYKLAFVNHTRHSIRSKIFSDARFKIGEFIPSKGNHYPTESSPHFTESEPLTTPIKASFVYTLLLMI